MASSVLEVVYLRLADGNMLPQRLLHIVCLKKNNQTLTGLAR